MDWKEFVLNLAIQSSIWQCLSGGARREIERPFLETKRILAGTGSVLLRPALCLSRLPRVWGLRGPSPAWPPAAATGWNKGEQRQKLDTARHRGESLTQHVLTSAGPRQQLASFLETYSECISAISVWPILVREARSVVSSPGLWTMQTPRSEEIQSSHESGSGHLAMASLW